MSQPLMSNPVVPLADHREAAEKAGNFTEAALVGTSLPMYVPDFKTVIMPAIAQAMDDWKGEALRGE